MSWVRRLGVDSLLRNSLDRDEAGRIVDSFVAETRKELGAFLRRVDHRADPQAISRLEKEKFLRARGSVPLDPCNQVNGSVLKISELLGEIDPDFAAAVVLYAALKCWSPHDGDRSEAMRDLLGVTRLFGSERDRLSPSKGQDKVLVLCRSRMMLLTAFEGGKLLPFASIWKALQGFLRGLDRQDKSALPALTALPKALAVAELNEARRCRSAALDAIDDSVIVLSLRSGLTGPDGREDLVRGLTGNGLDRWFGKTNIVADEQGHIGFYFDHAVADGQLIMGCSETFLSRAAALAMEPATHAQTARTQSVARFPEALEARWTAALQGYRREVARFSASRLDLTVAARDSGGLATALPLACQAAFRRRTGRLESPYVPVARTHESERGLEFVHGSAPGTARVIEDLDSSRVGDPAALRSALRWWRRSFLAAMLGPGGERFMHYLYGFAEEQGLLDHPFFEAAGYPDRLVYPPLCLTIVSGHKLVPAPVFPPVRGGWSVGVITHETGANLAVAGWDGAPARAAAEIGRAVEEILALLRVEPRKKRPHRGTRDAAKRPRAGSARPAARPSA